MMRWKRWVCCAAAALVMIVSLAGCGKDKEHGLSKKNPVTITVWHYYNGAQQEEFDSMVKTFNETVGVEKGILVESFSKGSIGELEKAVKDSAAKKVGSEDLPDACAAYADTVYQFDREGMVADIGEYLTKEEMAEYIDAYIEEGRFDDSGSVKLFPIAKSTEVLIVNETDWEKFAGATGASEEAFATWEGIAETAKQYYQWTDSLTPEPEDGKAFFGRDAFANYMIIGSMQLGHEIYRVEGGSPVLDFDRDAMRRLWDNYYVPYINGYFGSYGRFRSDDVKTGKLAAIVGATSGITFFPSSVNLEDGTTYEIRSKVYPLPNFENTQASAVQQGAGMMIFKSDETREYATTVFLKWFTSEENNIKFSMASGYLPVKKAANAREKVAELQDSQGRELISENLLTGLDVVNEYRLYTTKPFKNGDKARQILNSSMDDRAKADREAVVEMMENGVSREEAVAKFTADAHFEQWYEDTKQQLMSIGE